ncbi:conserved hypothetical protein [Candidatus Defluviicoccus seviourii]|uniref:Uncharacterized protein n=2 Tax=root TaxID=1 RepID=A0A564W9F4_9PROT|nr:conserved hypothetical protein [uncultured Defluviicoccus sp.]VUX45106.1 conserved hypothetical protein [Candidatus Defluviicoccus seviourii]
MAPAAADSTRLTDLLTRLDAATGPDPTLDRDIGQALGGSTTAGEGPAYTASIDRCFDLLHQVAPGWHWHVGFGVTGLLPYATLALGPRRFEASAATVPLALLNVIVRAACARSSPDI